PHRTDRGAGARVVFGGRRTGRVVPRQQARGGSPVGGHGRGIRPGVHRGGGVGWHDPRRRSGWCGRHDRRRPHPRDPRHDLRRVGSRFVLQGHGPWSRTDRGRRVVRPEQEGRAMTETATRRPRRPLLPTLGDGTGSVLAVLAVVLVALAFVGPAYSEPAGYLALLKRAAPLMILALGQYFVIVSGGFELSVGSLVTAEVVIAARLLDGDEAATA